MNQNQYSDSSKNKEHDSVFSMPLISLFDDKYWLYLQRRYNLTNRELQVAKLICQGFNNEDIAAKMKIKRGTVKTHIRNIYRRVRIRNKIQLILKFVDTATKFAAKPGTTSAIPIVEIKKSDKKTSAPTDTPKKE